VIERYGVIAKALAGSTERDDRNLAVAITQHVAAMPAAKTGHRLAVENALNGRARERVRKQRDHEQAEPDKK